MSCESNYPETDPASLDTSLIARMPAASGSAAQFLRDSAREFFRRSERWQDQRTTLVCNEDQSRYELPTDLDGRIVSVQEVWLAGQKVEQNKEAHGSADRSLRWYMHNPRNITFTRPPGEVVLNLKVVLTIKHDYGDASLIEQYREGILQGAMYFAAMSQDKKTSDQNVATYHKSLFEQEIRDASAYYQRQVTTERKPMNRLRALMEGNRN